MKLKVKIDSIQNNHLASGAVWSRSMDTKNKQGEHFENIRNENGEAYQRCGNKEQRDD